MYNAGFVLQRQVYMIHRKSMSLKVQFVSILVPPTFVISICSRLDYWRIAPHSNVWYSGLRIQLLLKCLKLHPEALEGIKVTVLKCECDKTCFQFSTVSCFSVLSRWFSISWIPWNLSFRYIHCTGQFTPKMKANAVPRLLSSLVGIDSGVAVSQHRLE